jgi:nucleoside phosphorylase
MSKRKLGLEDNQGPVSGVSKRSEVEREDSDSQEHCYTAAANIFSHDDYTVGWICALPIEMAAAKAMLDDIHTDLPVRPNDHNTYTLGRIGNHKIAIACLPSGLYGTASATTVANQMLSTFMSIRFGLMVGIGGGVPSKETDIRLGDIVVSKPTGSSGGVVQYDYGKAIGEGRFERTSALNKPPEALLTAVAKLQADHMLDDSRVPTFLSEIMAKRPTKMSNFTHRGQQQDRLFQADYDHVGSGNTCDNCDASKLVTRPARATDNPIVHYGLIASGNQVVKHGGTRDHLAGKLGILCFEMEAAGLMDNFPCLVIRGICDYADSHKNKQWQEYAAAAAAAYAKEILLVIPASQVAKAPTVSAANLNIGELLPSGF